MLLIIWSLTYHQHASYKALTQLLGFAKHRQRNVIMEFRGVPDYVLENLGKIYRELAGPLEPYYEDESQQELGWSFENQVSVPLFKYTRITWAGLC